MLDKRGGLSEMKAGQGKLLWENDLFIFLFLCSF